MKTVICLMLVSFGLGVDAESGSVFEVIAGLSFLVGGLGLSHPIIQMSSQFFAHKLPFKLFSFKKSHH